MTDCVFCERIRHGEYDRTHLERVVSFAPLNPVVDGHRLFVPFGHYADAADEPFITARTFAAAALHGNEEAEQFNLITSAGVHATQSVWHLHVHYVPRHEGDGLTLPWTTAAES